MNKCKVFFGAPFTIQSDLSDFLERHNITITHMTQSEHRGLDECTYITLIILYVE